MTNLSKYAELEALLFQYGEAMPIKKIQKFLDIKASEWSQFLADFEAQLRQENRGLGLISEGEKVQLATKAELKGLSEKIMKEEFREELTPATQETLSIIAYLGPITRPMIDYVRGVNSSFTLRNLLMRGLVEREHSEKSNLFFYRVSADFLKHIGLTKREELPDYEKYAELLKQFDLSK